MIEINEAKEIKERLKLEGKVEFLDKPEHIKSMIEMNEAMEKVRKDFLYKDARIEISAKDCWVYQN